MSAIDTAVRVRFAETDQMGVVHHSAYVIYLEHARVEWLRSCGVSYRQLEAEGISLAVSQLALEYRSAAYFDDELRIRTQLTQLKSRHLAFAYRIVRPHDGRLIALGETRHVPVARDGQSRRLPERYLNALAPYLSAGVP